MYFLFAGFAIFNTFFFGFTELFGNGAGRCSFLILGCCFFCSFQIISDNIFSIGSEWNAEKGVKTRNRPALLISFLASLISLLFVICYAGQHRAIEINLNFGWFSHAYRDSLLILTRYTSNESLQFDFEIIIWLLWLFFVYRVFTRFSASFLVLFTFARP